RMPLRGMSPEQLYDSIAEATGLRRTNTGLPPGVIAFGGPGDPREDLIGKFSEQSGKATEFQTSILHALALMNGRLIAGATSVQNSETLLAVIDNPFMTTAQRVETLYLAALSRPPRAKELSKMVNYVDGGGAGDDAGDKPAGPEDKQKQYARALADVFWVLLNSGEFLLSH